MAGKIEVFGKEDKKTINFCQKISKIIAKILKIDNKKINIYFVNWRKIKQLNNQFRHKNKPTTVLTFPSQKENFIYPPRESIFGEIIICLSQVKKQAREIKINPSEWLVRLLIHSFLHLLGFEHKNKREANKMEKKEKEIFEKIFKRKRI